MSTNSAQSLAMDQNTKPCLACGENILATAKKCKHCGEYLDDELRRKNSPSAGKNPGVAAVLAFLFPGLGHVYLGKIVEGIGWGIFILIGYCAMIIPGLVLHLISICGAYTSAKK